MACLAETSLARACNHLTQRLLVMCLQAGDRVSSLDVSDNSLAVDAANVTRHLPQLSNLKALAMDNCSLTSWPLAALRPGCLGALQALELCSNSFGGCLPADGLAACPGLKSLDLSGEMRRRCGPAPAVHVRMLSLAFLVPLGEIGFPRMACVACCSRVLCLMSLRLHAGVRGLRIPEGLFAATPQLEVLLACRAGLCELPPAVLGAASLTRLALGSNSISSLPVEVTQLTRWALSGEPCLLAEAAAGELRAGSNVAVVLRCAGCRSWTRPTTN